MPQVPISRSNYSVWDRKVAGSAPVRRIERLNGMRHKPEWDSTMPQNPVSIFKMAAEESMDWDSGDPSWDIRTDISSLTRYSLIWAWDPRFYATVYTKALNKARDGAELGLNIIQYRQSLSTFVQLSLLAATVVSATIKAHRIGFQAILNRRDLTPKKVKRELTGKRKALAAIQQREFADRQKARRLRTRLSNEIFILEHIAGFLLAWRYGVEPLMSDLYKTHEILCGTAEEPGFVRVSATKSVVAPDPGVSDWFYEAWTGRLRYSMRFVAEVDNPNAFLMNKLGFINPAYWAWDSTPWSFIVDWWFPVGDFLNNFTAAVGLTFKEVSFTQVASGECTHRATFLGTTYSGNAWFSSKERSVGGVSLPPPTSVPYGKGLSVNRAQNALALIVQKLNPRKNLLKRGA